VLGRDIEVVLSGLGLSNLMAKVSSSFRKRAPISM